MRLFPEVDADGRWPRSFAYPFIAVLCLTVWALIGVCCHGW